MPPVDAEAIYAELRGCRCCSSRSKLILLRRLSINDDGSARSSGLVRGEVGLDVGCGLATSRAN